MRTTVIGLSGYPHNLAIYFQYRQVGFGQLPGFETLFYIVSRMNPFTVFTVFYHFIHV